MRDVLKYARTRTPPDARSATLSAVCAMSIARRQRWRSRDSVDRDDAPDAMPADAAPDALIAGTRPAASDDTIAHAAANIATRQSMRTSPRTAVLDGAIAISAGSSHAPRKKASTVPVA